MYTPAQALVPRISVPKCTQHSLQKNAHRCTHTHICIRIHMHTNTHWHAHPRHCPTRLAIETHNPCTNMHTHTYTHVYTCIRILIHIHAYIYVNICSYTHIHTQTYTHTGMQHVRMHARRHAWNDGEAATAREARLDARNQFHGSRDDTLDEAVAIFDGVLNQSSHTEFWKFSISRTDLYPQISKFELK